MGKIPIDRMLEIARHAPSGDNLQPWSFKTDEEDVLTLLYQPSPIREPAYYLSGVYCSLGIMIEYVVLAAASLGFAAKVDINPNFHHEKDHLVAKFTFTPDKSLIDSAEIKSLVSAMQSRHTVRLPYKKTLLPEAIADDLKKAAGLYGANLILVDNKNVRARLATFVKLSDKYFWDSSQNRQSLVKSIYNDRLEPDRAHGMPASTLGVGVFASVITKYFALAQKLPFLWTTLKIKASADATSNIYSSSGIGFIQVPKTGPTEFVAAKWSGHDHIMGGRAVARLWLTVTKNKLVLQPIYHFVAMSVNKDNQSLGREFIEANSMTLPILDEIIGEANDKKLVFAFRIGFPRSDDMSYPGTPRYPLNDICHVAR